MKGKQTLDERLTLLCKALKLPAFVALFAETARQAESQGWTFEQYLHHLAECELEERRRRRVQRNLKRSMLPQGKTLAALTLGKLPAKVRRQVTTLCEGGFVDRAENVLAFGLPGRGKTHLLCAIAHELIQRGRTVLFCPAFKLVQMLLVAKRELELEQALRKLDRFDVVLVDDIGYIQQNREEMEVLFTLLAHRYERGSVLITSNLPFSKWEMIFKDPMTTAAAIDRLVHHSVILELNVPSYRAEQARKLKNKDI